MINHGDLFPHEVMDQHLEKSTYIQIQGAYLF